METDSYDVVVIGAGLAGVITAVVLERMGVRVLLVDTHPSYPHSFKAEKIGNEHARQLRRLGVLEWVAPVATPIREYLEAYHGTRIARVAVEHYGILYHDLVNAIRRRLPDALPLSISRVRQIATSADRQIVSLEDGQTIEARLVVLASGRSIDLFKQLNLRRQVISPMHSMSFGFTVAKEHGGWFDFDELTYWGDRTAPHVPHVTLFRVAATTRANVFAYWKSGDKHLSAFHDDPVGELHRIMPGLFQVTEQFHLISPVESCPLHLHAIEGHYQSGVVVIGDAFRTVCPAAGTGVVKALMDVECLCMDFIPRWLATPGMGTHKVAQFYDSPRKKELDRRTLNVSLKMRRTAVDPRLQWRLRRAARSLKRSGRAWLARTIRNSPPSTGGTEYAIPMSAK